jgi:4-hydroxy-tetrahydrodipicolinate reductase
VGQDIGSLLGLPPTGIIVSNRISDSLAKPTDVLIDYTRPELVKQNTLEALNKGCRVVIGTSGLSNQDFMDIDKKAKELKLGVIAAGNFSITATLAKHFALLAAKYIDHREIIDYAISTKPDAPSGTARELAEEMANISANKLDLNINDTLGLKESRGAIIGGTPVHSVRIPSYTLSFEAIFGLPDERVTIRHDAGQSAQPYIAGTLLAVKKVMQVIGLVRGLDHLLFIKGL